jgi:hypothetical protein
MSSKVSQQHSQKTFDIAEILPVSPSRPTLDNQRAAEQSIRGIEAADEDQTAVAELLQASIADGTAIPREIAIVRAATTQRVSASPKATHAQKAARTQRSN